MIEIYLKFLIGNVLEFEENQVNLIKV